MDQINDFLAIDDVCKSLMKEISCDFIGLALQDKNGLNIKWHYAIGNLNEKYRLITVRFGKGIAGKVISSGTPLMIDDFPNNVLGKPIEQPIMLAENLVSSYAVPLFFKGVPKGVLLIGNRETHSYTEDFQTSVKESAGNLEKILSDHIVS
ncbi:GAF domain-containing protein [Neobacillus terrae]|uniref:GAF domain-containing protein n=1 Tax=Neobacillus terrae TaxID=3034837 RepID=UPI00140A4085|nr:GAF domain-containing protein [Neobacillus terrae]NHM31546.1 GAF domain-containing protein [Neobacillus terrae]